MDEPPRPRILLVEDDPAVRRSLQLLLVGRGYDVRSYPGSGGLAREPEALSAACLVADLIVPDGNAIELLGELRRAGWPGVAILISGNLTPEWTRQAREAGYASIIPKPIGENVLVNVIAELLGAGAGPNAS